MSDEQKKSYIRTSPVHLLRHTSYATMQQLEYYIYIRLLLLGEKTRGLKMFCMLNYGSL